MRLHSIIGQSIPLLHECSLASIYSRGLICIKWWTFLVGAKIINKEDASIGLMGFRNLHAFNLSKLGKQGWNLLITNQDTTVFKVFKAKCFSYVNFLDAQLGLNPSFVRGSTYPSLVVVKQGDQWRVGNGESIHVWSQPWLNNVHNPNVSTNPNYGNHNLLIELTIIVLFGEMKFWKQMSIMTMQITFVLFLSWHPGKIN